MKILLFKKIGMILNLIKIIVMKNTKYVMMNLINDYELNSGHLFGTICWFNYLKILIIEAKVDKIKCMDVSYKEILTEEFILKQISRNSDLVKKYEKFKKQEEILKDKIKKCVQNQIAIAFYKNQNR